MTLCVWRGEGNLEVLDAGEHVSLREHRPRVSACVWDFVKTESSV